MSTILESGPVFTLLLVPAIVEVGLGVLVWRRTSDRTHGRFLAGSLLTHGLALFFAYAGLVVVHARFGFDPGTARSIEQVGEIGLLTLGSIVPALDLSFALTFPTFVGWLQRRKWLLALPFVPAIGLIAWLPSQVRTARFTHGDDPTTYTRLFVTDTGFMTFAAYDVGAVFLAALASALIFWNRARRAKPVDRRRLRFMFRAVSIPMVCSVALFILIFASGVVGVSFDSEFMQFFIRMLLLPLIILAVTIIPPLAMGYGVLRYRILDWDRSVRRGARFTVSYTLLTAVFAVVFFGLSEAAEYLLRMGTNSGWVGLAGAGILAIAIQPLHRSTAQLARRLFPERSETDAKEARRREIYRAAFDDLREDGVTTQERKALSALATSLKLSSEAAESIESEAGIELKSVPTRRSRWMIRRES